MPPYGEGMINSIARSAPLRWTLLPFSLMYGVVVRGRNLYYEAVASAARHAGIPVICIGNLTTGGTGKTPLVIDVARRLSAMGRRPAIITRGYAARSAETSDEVLEIRAALPEIPVVVNADRVAAVAGARRDHDADCVVLDDGFQHRRLARDLDIVVIDALDPWGGGRLLPAGRLREPMSSLRRAGLFVISRANQVGDSVVQAIREATLRIAPHRPILTAHVQVDRAVALGEQQSPATDLRNAKVLAVCGIGNPATFLRLLSDHGCRVCDRRIFPDHHRYRAPDAERIAAAAERAGVERVVTTRKDWVKLAPLWRGLNAPAELVRVDIRLDLCDAAGELDEQLHRVVEQGS